MRAFFPALLGASAGQVNVLIDSIFASFLTAGAVSWLYYAERFMGLPLGVFGVGIASVVLPMLAKAYAGENQAEYQKLLQGSLRLMLVLALPSAFALWVLAWPIFSALFAKGAMRSEDITQSAMCLQMYALGIPALMCNKIMQASLYAKQKFQIALGIALLMVVMNIILNSILMPIYAHLGLALATSICAWLQCVMYGYFLYSDELHLFVKQEVLQVSLACLMMSGSLWWVMWVCQSDFEGWAAVLQLIAMMGFGLCVYLLGLWVCRFPLKRLMS